MIQYSAKGNYLLYTTIDHKDGFPECLAIFQLKIIHVDRQHQPPPGDWKESAGHEDCAAKQVTCEMLRCVRYHYGHFVLT